MGTDVIFFGKLIISVHIATMAYEYERKLLLEDEAMTIRVTAIEFSDMSDPSKVRVYKARVHCAAWDVVESEMVLEEIGVNLGDVSAARYDYYVCHCPVRELQISLQERCDVGQIQARSRTHKEHSKLGR